jgi:hypothetical protein
MCHQIICSRCDQPTWTGCGRHIEQALANIPADERCSCDRPAPSGAKFFGRLIGR